MTAQSGGILRFELVALGLTRADVDRLAPGAVVRGPSAFKATAVQRLMEAASRQAFQSFELEWLALDLDATSAALKAFMADLCDTKSLLAFRLAGAFIGEGPPLTFAALGARRADGEVYVVAAPWAARGATPPAVAP